MTQPQCKKTGFTHRSRLIGKTWWAYYIMYKAVLGMTEHCPKGDQHFLSVSEHFSFSSKQCTCRYSPGVSAHLHFCSCAKHIQFTWALTERQSTFIFTSFCSCRPAHSGSCFSFIYLRFHWTMLLQVVFRTDSTTLKQVFCWYKTYCPWSTWILEDLQNGIWLIHLGHCRLALESSSALK